MSTSAFGLALVACVSFGAGAVLQKRGMGAAMPAVTWARVRRPLGPDGLLRHVAANGPWLAGFGLELLGWAAYVICVAVLGGELVVVQPLVAGSVVVTIALGYSLLGERPSRAEWLAATLMLAGGALTIAARLAVDDDPAEVVDAQGLTAFVIGVATLAGLSLLALARGTRSGDLAWAVLAGACFCGSVVATRLAGILYRQHFADLAPGSWESAVWVVGSPAVWLMTAFTWGGFLLTQGAYRRGQVAVVEPLISLIGLVLPTLGGVMIFHEPYAGASIAGGALFVLGFAALLGGRHTGAVPGGGPTSPGAR